MTTLNFRLPANRSDLRASHRPMPVPRRPGAGTMQATAIVRPMDAEVAALIALRRLGARDLQWPPAAGTCNDEIAPRGWFDSTWELANGLDIAEGMPADLPLDGWLQFYLAA